MVSISLHCVFAEILPSEYFSLRLHTQAVNTCIDLEKAFVLRDVNPLNAELNSICHLVALLGVHHFLHVSRIRVKVTINPC